MSASDQDKPGAAAGWFANGPWRSKTVLAAFAVVVVGLCFWYYGIQNAPQNEPGNAAPNAAEFAPTGPAGAPPAPAPSKWSKPLPVYVWIGASYVAGYCVGWLFRKLLRLILVVSALAIALLAYGKFAGFDLQHAQEQVKRGGEWAQQEAKAAKDYFKQMLPSTAAGGVGMFLGFLRRRRGRVSKPAG